MIVRQMRLEDKGPAYRITCASLDEYYAPEVFSYFMMQWPKGQLVACDYTGKVVGYILGSLLEGRSMVPLFAVDEPMRGKGVGDQLLKEFKLRSIIDGRPLIQLEVRAKNLDSLNFYKKRGFVEVEYMPDFYVDHGDAIRLICTAYVNS
ncbi:MAG: N-acetyltransferase [Candidatus Methanomethylophilaceae archaeon]|nr:GNAT family N-acetyltransferase [Candidatus Methanomethylophilaceae archaeon]MDD3378486.1 N-acetyltransferase [Candidatus Methanomethylophilaceae archaeon]MDY0224154.1 N-acetyltransferase [Candidatus Methanomethylophilaceae archaeon]